MAGNALTATGIMLPQINTVDRFAEGNAAAQQSQANQIEIAQKAMSNIGSIALESMGGKMDGQVDPQKFSQGLDILQAHGMDVSKFRDHPEIAPVAAAASVTALQQLANARDDAAAEMAVKQFGMQITKFQNDLAHQDNWVDLTDPAERAKHGIPANDTGMYQLNTGSGEVKPLSGKGQTINVGGNNDIGTIPPGYAVDRDATGNVVGMHKIPGGIADDKAAEDQATADAKKKLADTGANIVTTDISRALDQIAKDPEWTTGMGALATGWQPSSDAHSVAGFVDTVRANATIDKLQQMRASSPTGAALGSVTEGEEKMLADAIGALDPTMKREDFEYNLKRVYNIYKDIVEGTDVGQRFDLSKTGAPLSDAPDTGGDKSGNDPFSQDKAEETKDVNGVTYWRIGADWYH